MRKSVLRTATSLGHGFPHDHEPMADSNDARAVATRWTQATKNRALAPRKGVCCGAFCELKRKFRLRLLRFKKAQSRTMLLRDPAVIPTAMNVWEETMEQISAVLFDLFGTLLDLDQRALLRDMRREVGGAAKQLSPDIFRRMLVRS